MSESDKNKQESHQEISWVVFLKMFPQASDEIKEEVLEEFAKGMRFVVIYKTTNLFETFKSIDQRNEKYPLYDRRLPNLLFEVPYAKHESFRAALYALRYNISWEDYISKKGELATKWSESHGSGWFCTGARGDSNRLITSWIYSPSKNELEIFDMCKIQRV
jgi:hypothetical protein